MSPADRTPDPKQPPRDPEASAARPAAPEPQRSEPSLSGLIKELRDEATTLIRQEVELAKTELVEKSQELSRQSMSLMAGGAILFAGLIILLFGIGDLVAVGLVDAGVSIAVAAWLGPSIVGIVTAIIGLFLVMSAKKKLSAENLKPERTARSLKEDKQWIKNKFQKA